MQVLTNPLTFDSGLFYPGMFSDAAKNQYYSANIKALRATVEEAIFILRKLKMDVYLTQFNILDKQLSGDDAVAGITTRTGIPVVMIRQIYKATKNGEMLPHIELICRHVELKERGAAHSVTSTKTQYIAKVLKNYAYAIKSRIALIEPELSVGEACASVNGYAESSMHNPSSKTVTSVHTSDLMMLTNIMEGKYTYDSLTPPMQMRLDSVRNQVRQIAKDISAVGEKINSFFSMPKWRVSYHAGVERANGYVTVGISTIACYKKGTHTHTRDFVPVNNYHYEIDWLLPMQVYPSLDAFFEKVGSEMATDLSLTIKTELIRKQGAGMDTAFDSNLGIPTGMSVDFDTGIGMSRYSSNNSSIAYEFVCDCTVTQ